MKVTFGIITDGTKDERIVQIVNSIYANNIPKDSFEIIVVGNSKIVADNTRVIPFDESQKPGWITKKKNLITEEAKFDTIVYSHDYFKYSPEWYQGFLNCTYDWDICMCPLITTDGLRYRDFARMGRGNEGGSWYWIPYEEVNPKQWDISGGWWISRKETMKRYPLNENLVWGEGEDGEMSDRMRGNVVYVCNSNSFVHLMKPKQILCRWK